jgi:hypothetical protein
LQDLWNIDDDASHEAADLMTESIPKTSTVYEKEQLSSVALDHLSAMNDLILSACERPLADSR